MNKGLSLALLLGGAALTIFGLVAYGSTSSDIARFVTGAAADKSIWLLLAGIVVTTTGLAGLSYDITKK